MDDYDDIDDEEPKGNICQRTGIGHYCYSMAAPYSQPGSDSPTMAYEGGLAAGFAAVRPFVNVAASSAHFSFRTLRDPSCLRIISLSRE